jgi:CheY-like chemotaxis protein
MASRHRNPLGRSVGNRLAGHTRMPSTAERLEHERRGTVLVIAGHDLRSDVASALTDAGYRVVTIGSTTEALHFLRRQTTQPAMIVLDWSAPGISGLQFVAFHASSPTYSETPVAVIAEPTNNNVPRLCVVAIVYRPVDEERLLEVVDRGTRVGVQRRGAGERKLALS